MLQAIAVDKWPAAEHLMDGGDGRGGSAGLRLDHRCEPAQLELVDSCLMGLPRQRVRWHHAF